MRSFIIPILLSGFLFSGTLHAQTIDTLINVGKYKLHFSIIPGRGTPILFESGGGNDATVWKNVAGPVAEITGAPVVTYDRPGLGSSGIDSADMTLHNDITGLETALNQLGFGKAIMLVAHSLGGFYNSVYAYRNSEKIKAMVLFDANLPSFFSQEHLNHMKATTGFRSLIETVRKYPLPADIPIMDIISEKTLFEGTPDAERWKACHFDFVAASPNRKQLIALETGHYIFLQNRQLAINAIVTYYANYAAPSQKSYILERAYAQELSAANEDRQRQVKYLHSEADLNEWGYTFMQKKEWENAIEVFKLNTILHPQSGNAFDSLGEAYLKIGNTKMAIESYQKCLQLNPDSKNAKKILAGLLR